MLNDPKKSNNSLTEIPEPQRTFSLIENQSMIDLFLNNNPKIQEIQEKEGHEAVISYLNQNVCYAIKTTPADWGIFSSNSIFLGSIGHHAFLDLPEGRRCEWAGSPTKDNVPISGIDEREVPRWVVEKMWATHKELSPKYQQIGGFDTSPEGFLHYRPFKNDCFNYVGRILQENKQPQADPEKISRTKSSQDWKDKTFPSTEKPSGPNAER